MGLSLGQKALCVVCASWIIFDWIMKTKLFAANHSVALYLQDGDHDIDSFRYLIFRVISQLGYEKVVGLTMVFGFLFLANKIEGLKVFIFSLFSSFVLSQGKLFYHEPRPYFVYPDLEGIGCDSEFGKPSGHALCTIVLYFLFFNSYFNGRFEDVSFQKGQNIPDQELGNYQAVQFGKTIVNIPQDESNKFIGINWKFIAFIIVIFLIGLSRVVLGVHSFGQVILGWAYGTLLLVAYYVYFSDVLQDLLQKIAYGTWEKHSNEKRTAKVKLIGIYATLILMSIALYLYTETVLTSEEKQSYADNIHSKKYCNSFDETSNKFLNKKCLMDSATISMVFGLLISALCTNGTYSPEQWNSSFAFTPLAHRVLRLFVLGGMLAVVALSFHFLVAFKNVYIYYIFKQSLSALLVGFILIKVYPYVLSKLGLDIQGDFLKAEEQQHRIVHA